MNKKQKKLIFGSIWIIFIIFILWLRLVIDPNLNFTDIIIYGMLFAVGIVEIINALISKNGEY